MQNPKAKSQKAPKGFTLIELAVVIAIIAILAAVALPRFGNTTANAELSVIKDLKSQLASSAAIYTAEQSATPNGFTDYVTQNATPTGAFTLSVAKVGTGSCTVDGTSITCTGFKKWNNVSYTFAAGGTISGTATATGTGNTLGTQTF